jgi:hypothetical protein
MCFAISFSLLLIAFFRWISDSVSQFTVLLLEELGNKNVNQQWNSFKNKVIELQNKHIPHKSVRNRLFVYF